MIHLVAVLACLLQTDSKKDLKEACARMDQLKSYHFTLRILSDGEEKLSMEGEYAAPALLHVRSAKFEAARNGDRKLVKLDGTWQEPKDKKRKVNELEAAMPHEWVRKIVDMVPALKREKSTKLDGQIVDIYVHSLAHEEARTSAEASGMALWGSIIDWSRTKNGVLFYLGRDDLMHRVEQRIDGRGKDGKKADHAILLDLGEWNRAKCRLSDDVKGRLGVK